MQIQRTRAKWAGPATQYCYVCSGHFAVDTNELVHNLMTDMGMKRTSQLKSKAILTIFPREIGEETEPKTVRLAFEKHERIGIM